MINYFVIARKNPQTKAVKYYASARRGQQVPLSQICEQIAEESSLTTADVKACIDRLMRHVKLQLIGGNSVKLGELGTFRPTLESEGTDSVKAFKAENVKKIRVRFVPSSALKQALRVTNTDVSFHDMTKETVEQTTA